MSPPAKRPGKSKKRYERVRATRHLSQLTKPLMDPLFRRQGFAKKEIVTRWADIVGVALAQSSRPEKISFPRHARQGGTLMVRVEGSFALELQHRQADVLERLNSYFGYQAVDKIVIRQGPLPRDHKARQEAALNLSEQDQKQIDSLVEDTNNDRLRQSLMEIGRQVKGKNR
jgi:hypothetical protein